MSDGDGRSAGGRPWLPPGRFVTLPGRGRTYVRELAGPPGAPVVVLLHGWSATADLTWFASFEPLSRHFRVLSLDHRGHGRGVRSGLPFRLEDCADDIAALARQLDVDDLIAVGYSMGGPIAQLLWRRHGSLVSGLVLCATSAVFTGTVRERMLFGAAAGTSALTSTVPVHRLTPLALNAWSGWRAWRGGTWWGWEEVARHDWAQVVDAGRAVGRFDSRPWVGGVDVPTAVITTSDDDVVPPARQRALAAAIPGATVHPVIGGHAVCTTSPQVFVPELVGACLDVARRSMPRRRAARAA